MSGEPFRILWEAAEDGWQVVRAERPGRFLDIFGDIRVRADPDGRVRLRIETAERHANVRDTISGAFIMAFTDLVVSVAPAFGGAYSLGEAVTLHGSSTFIAPGVFGEPLEAVAEVTQAGRTLFVRGALEQPPARVATFEGVMLKRRRG